MKFIVSSKSLLSQLQIISGVINNNNTLPILDHFLFDLDSNKLTITATITQLKLVQHKVNMHWLMQTLTNFQKEQQSKTQ